MFYSLLLNLPACIYQKTRKFLKPFKAISPPLCLKGAESSHSFFILASWSHGDIFRHGLCCLKCQEMSHWDYRHKWNVCVLCTEAVWDSSKKMFSFGGCDKKCPLRAQVWTSCSVYSLNYCVAFFSLDVCCHSMLVSACDCFGFDLRLTNDYVVVRYLPLHLSKSTSLFPYSLHESPKDNQLI